MEKNAARQDTGSRSHAGGRSASSEAATGGRRRGELARLHHRRTRNASSPIRSRRTSTLEGFDALSPPYPRPTAAEMLARIGVVRHRRPVRRRSRRTSASPASARPAARRRARSRSSATSAAWRAETSPAGSVPFFVGAGAYQPPRAGERRSPDPALGIPDRLHALPARDRARHAAIPLRVPDPGGACSPAWRWPTPRCTTARPAPPKRC